MGYTPEKHVLGEGLAVLLNLGKPGVSVDSRRAAGRATKQSMAIIQGQ